MIARLQVTQIVYVDVAFSQLCIYLSVYIIDIMNSVLLELELKVVLVQPYIFLVLDLNYNSITICSKDRNYSYQKNVVFKFF